MTTAEVILWGCVLYLLARDRRTPAALPVRARRDPWRRSRN